MSDNMPRIGVIGLGYVGLPLCVEFSKIFSTVGYDIDERRIEHLKAGEDVDLRCQSSVDKFFSSDQIDQVYLAAARVGGIHANNTFPGDFIHENLLIQNNVISASLKGGVDKLLFLGSSCIYPKFCDQPMREESLLTGLLEPTNEPYAIAKIAGIKLCESFNRQHGTDFRSVMPTNLYGPGDYYHPLNSHVIPALIDRFYRSTPAGERSVTVWGTGKAKREFIYVDDMASACLHVMSMSNFTYQSITEPMVSHINIGYGSDYSIAELAEKIARVTDFNGAICWDEDKPDGTPRKLLCSSELFSTDWGPSMSLDEGLGRTLEDYIKSKSSSGGIRT